MRRPCAIHIQVQVLATHFQRKRVSGAAGEGDRKKVVRIGELVDGADEIARRLYRPIRSIERVIDLKAIWETKIAGIVLDRDGQVNSLAGYGAG